MPKTRLLLIDDSVVVRRILSEALASEPQLDVVGTAPNGRIGLAKIPQVNPDLVVLDVEMPEMDGLQTLAELRKQYPRLPVIMFSTLTQRGATAALEALARGANDYATKPANVSNVEAAKQSVRDQLLPKIKVLCQPASFERRPSALPSSASRPAAPLRPGPAPGAAPPARVDLVVIGVSTGGPNALAAVLPALPARLPVPVLIVQHMPPLFTGLLAKRLAASSAVRVAEATEGALLQPGQVWLAPGDYHMTVERTPVFARLHLNQEPPENSCRPAVDVLFRSAAAGYGGHILAVVLTGMGQDGLRGCEQIHAAGGQVIVQDAATSVVWGMPGYVARAGLADETLPLNQIGPAIVRRVRAARDWNGL